MVWNSFTSGEYFIINRINNRLTENIDALPPRVSAVFTQTLKSTSWLLKRFPIIKGFLIAPRP
ncbi:unnamed protein product [Nezara viridula]|uniref:Uncharacterized protein n=1 Tax=Nezara viridula TaxID=85310 RepID=A0A9P0HDX1_NEZVI|nr:unnamed protein product [Nezara viridula]